MDKLGITVGHLGADGAVSNGIDFRSPHGEHAITGHGYCETAGIRTVERTDASLLHGHGAMLHFSKCRAQAEVTPPARAAVLARSTSPPRSGIVHGACAP